jgi:succinate-acetate transporter protein
LPLSQSLSYRHSVFCPHLPFPYRLFVVHLSLTLTFFLLSKGDVLSRVED